MANEPLDAWRTIPPLDRLARIAPPMPQQLSLSKHHTPIHCRLKGTEFIAVLNEGSDEETWCRFTYNRQSQAWQLHRRPDWVADGPPSERAGEILEMLVQLLEKSHAGASRPQTRRK